MSSYLDNIVLRTLALAPVAQPRLASVFEPGTGGRAAARQADAQVESSGEQAPSANGSRSVTQELHTTVQVVQAQPELKDFGGSPKKRSVTSDAKPVERKPAPASLPVAEVLRAPSELNKVARPIETDLRPAHRTIPKEVEAKPETKRSARNVTVVDERGGLWQKLEPRIRELVRDELPPSQTPVDSLRREPTVIGPQVVPVAPRTRSKSDSIAPAPTKIASTTNPPMPITNSREITVTIGRVDVRAIISSAAESKRIDSPRAVSPTTLDQYLKERSEGRR